MSIVESLKDFIAACPHLNVLAEIHVDEVAPDTPNYSIDTLPGGRTIATDVLDNKTREFPFAFTSRQFTVDDLARITSSGFYENFADWLDEQTDAEKLPDLGTKKKSESIEATSWGYLYQTEENAQTGIYQIICKLTYTETKG